MSNFPPGYLRHVDQSVHDERAKNRRKLFQLLLCDFSVKALCTEFNVTAATISSWRRGQTNPRAAIMKRRIKRMWEMKIERVKA